MKEKELRIALVCFGGVSLAVYMHGITKEVLKLVRASGVLHAIRDRDERARASFFDKVNASDPEYDTDAIYFELLRDIGCRTVELRVIVDIVAGASAGGINGTMLARALSHDLPMGALRDLWLEHADVTDLLAPEARARVTSKVLLTPVVWFLGATGLWKAVKDPEVRRKVSLFVRSRWFKPPLSGARMAELMYNAVTAMGRPKHSLASLMPSGQRLDLFVTVTDHYGYQQPVQIHDPPIIHEREHRHMLRFRYQRRANGEVISDFDFENAPALAFAARATSSFPGAFPPTQISEMDELVARRGDTWPHRGEFIARNFEAYTRMNVDPTTACFLDGSVLNNRPFRAAISAIRGRPAYRQVDRRLVYIDPDPAPPDAPIHREIPGFFTTLKGALSDLPSAEPVTDELTWVNNYNDRINRVRAIIEDARPHISQLVSNIATGSFDKPITSEEIRAWRENVNNEVAIQCRLCLRRLCPAQDGVGPRVRLEPDRVAARRAGAIAVRPCHCGNHQRVVGRVRHALWQRKASRRASRDREGGQWDSELGEVPARLRRRLPQATPALHDRRPEPALSGVRQGALRGLRPRGRRSAQAEFLRLPRCAQSLRGHNDVR